MTLRTWHGHGTRQAHREAADHTTLREIVDTERTVPIDQALETEIRVASLDGRLVIMSIYKDESGVIWLDVE